ncbi:LacI family DNA-binding transcriptional regulator [Providencia rettgeri]|uniref:LacI family DNA-binding transcriptional regulator n=1 Tax=Providencia sp. 2024EL-00732 TaxID=3374242 RepID=UPI0024ABCBE3|nr:LacI family DNA-binding transcriptional regulator [Providencia rettgeri]EJD6402594.1 LacI family DNA-binding transcriptional regulator [Providencia rettgeri]EJD6614339.1 LacI family DNA-binding transcriptional regulator [Providencia rettgeri]EJD6615948.1 LacI family DNA-binding transcriptional regulator [Providencia rettgeri]ELL9150359.1 LacI family DNA-binding transcriptional regulator [Providencia rettgeri]
MSTVNSKDVARLANVSQSAVSLVFSGRYQGRVSEKTREKILCVAKELGYQPNINAQILRSGNSRTVAFIVPDIQQPYFGKVVHAAELSATKSGYSLILLDSYANKQWSEHLFSLFQSKLISGCIIYSCEKKHIELLENYRDKLIFIESDDEKNNDILLDIDKTIKSAFSITHKMKRFKVGFFRSDIPRQHFLNRHKLFNNEFESLNYVEKSKCVVYSSFNLAEATQNAASLLQQKPNIVFCDDDLLAGALYRAAKQLNITIPKDVAVIGFNDTDLCNYLNPELSTVKIPTQYIGELAIKMLLDKISDRKEPIKQEVIKLEIITRGSTQF